MDWQAETIELKAWFRSIELPSGTVQFDQCSKIIDIRKFLNSHFEVLNENNGKAIFEPFIIRLRKLKEILK